MYLRGKGIGRKVMEGGKGHGGKLGFYSNYGEKSSRVLEMGVAEM